MPVLKTRRIFISHAWDYDAHYDTLVGWLDEAPNFSWVNYSIPLTNSVDFKSKKELKEKITNKVNQVHCVVIFAGMYTAYSEWIDYEIDEAIRLGKPIVAVKPWGQERIPAKIKDSCDSLVGWNRYSVISAIREYSD